MKVFDKFILALHWDPTSKSYTDISFDGEGSVQHVVHNGYISLFPLLLGILPKDSPKLDHLLDLVSSDQLFSSFGVCSLSKSDAAYGTGENYWRGPIWIPINYLLLQSLHNNYMQDGPYHEKAGRIYTELRANIIKNVYEVELSLILGIQVYGIRLGAI